MGEHTFAYIPNSRQLELQGKVLSDGDSVEICVLGHWIPGHLALDSTGWYFLTSDRVGIRLYEGIAARLPKGVRR